MNRDTYRMAAKISGMAVYMWMMTGLLILPVAAQNTQTGEKKVAYAADAGLFHNISINQDDTTPAVLNKIISLRLKRATLIEALQEIAVKAGLKLSYRTEFVPLDRKLTLELNHVTINEALWKVLEGTGLRYAVSANGHLVLLKRQEVLAKQLQTGTITGKVVEASTNEPLPGANVFIEGTQIGSSTNVDGRYSITNVESGSHRLIATFIGYQRMAKQVNIQENDTVTVNFVLEASSLNLNEIVVTGVAGGTQRRALGNDLATVDAVETVEIAPIQNMQSMLGSRIAGVDVSTGTGVLGGGSSTRIRGISSLTLSNEPLLYIDGVRVDNNPSAGPSGLRQSRTVSRINDINPENIKSVEVIKGPAAATLYGTEASNGVIQIITKKGNIGEPQLNVSLRSGFNFLLGASYRLPGGYRRAPDGSGDLLEWNIYTQEKEKGNLRDTFLQNGLVQTYSADISGGNEGIRYYIAGSFDDSEGYIPWNTKESSNARANVSAFPNEKLNISAGIGYNTSNTRFAQHDAPYGIWDSVVWGHTDRRSNLGFYTTPPGVSPANIEARSILKRVTWSLAVNHNPVDWFEQRLTLGQDYSSEINTQLHKKLAPTSRQYFGGKSQGNKDREDVLTTYRSFDYSATGRFDLSEKLNSSTSFGVQFYSKEIDISSASGRIFPSRGIESVGGAAITTGSEDLLQNKTLGAYIQNQFSWEDRLYLTLAVRGDDNSAFGTNFDAVIYPKISMAWVVHEEPFFNIPWISTLKLRAAYGQSGQQPDVFAAAQLYVPATGPGDAAVITPDNKGNPDLGPEKGEEIEVGFEALLLNNVNIGFTFYDQKTKDAILARRLPLSSGFPSTQFVNLGEVHNQGLELEINGNVIQNSNLNWNLGGIFSWNENELVDLGGIPETEELYTSLKEGYPVWGYWGIEIVDAELDANNEVIMNSIMCKQADGPPKLCTESAPRIFKGPQTPKFQGSINTQVSFLNNWTFYTNIDYKLGHYRGDGDVGHGHMLMNHTKATVGYPMGEGVLETETIPGVGEMVYTRYSQSTPPNPIGRAYAVDPGGWGRNLFIHNAGFIRLRELSLRYNIPQQWSRSIGINRASVTASGRNLWFLYRAQKEILDRPIIDPEIAGPQNFRGQEQTNLAPMSSFIITTRLSF